MVLLLGGNGYLYPDVLVGTTMNRSFAVYNKNLDCFPDLNEILHLVIDHPKQFHEDSCTQS